ncbi:MAG: WG repeat-containing protein [Bacteroidota bacterium]
MATQSHFKNIQSVVINKIHDAKHSIQVAVAWLTDTVIFDELCSKARNGLKVELILNDDQINKSVKEFHRLFEKLGGNIYWHPTNDKRAIMHHKFCIIDENIVINGSYNWSRKAQSNDENITVSENDKELCVEFLNEFESIKRRLVEAGEISIFSNELPDFIPYRNGDKWGFCDKNKKVVVEPIYDYCYLFKEGLAKVKLEGTYGFIDKNGNVVIQFIYEDACDFSDGLARVSLKKWCRYDELQVYEYHDKWGYIDKSGTQIIACKYDYACDFSEGLAKVSLKEWCCYYEGDDPEYHDKWGYIDKNGEQIIPCKYDSACAFSEGLAKVKLNGGWGYIDKNGEEIIPCIYDRVGFFSEGIVKVTERLCHDNYDSYDEEDSDISSFKYGYIDKNGNEIAPCIYDNGGEFSDGFAAVRLYGKLGYIDKNGEEIFPINYDFFSAFNVELPKVTRNGNLIYIDSTGRRIYRSRVSKKLGPVKRNDKWGYIDKNGKETTPCMYDYGGDFRDGLAKVCLDDKWGYIDKSGTQIIACKYDYGGDFSDGLAKVMLNGGWGYIDKSGTQFWED